MRLKPALAVLLLLVLNACYADMRYGVEEKTEEEQDEAWWCKFRNNCPEKEADTWW